MVCICRPVTFALLVTLPCSSFADRLEDLLNQQQLAYSRHVAQSFPQNEIQMPSQQLLGLSGQQLGSQQMPYAQGMSASPYLGQQNVANMEATISSLQTQIATERTNEVQLVNLVAQEQQRLQKENASFARVLTLVETGAEQEHELRSQLTNAKAKNEALQEELRKASEKALQNEGELAKWRDEAKEAQQQVKQSAFLQKQAEHVMQDVRLAQAKVRRSEQIIHSLLPRLQSQPRVQADVAPLQQFLSKAGPRVAAGQDIQGASSQEAYDNA